MTPSRYIRLIKRFVGDMFCGVNLVDRHSIECSPNKAASVGAHGQVPNSFHLWSLVERADSWSLAIRCYYFTEKSVQRNPKSCQWQARIGMNTTWHDFNCLIANTRNDSQTACARNGEHGTYSEPEQYGSRRWNTFFSLQFFLFSKQSVEVAF